LSGTFEEASSPPKNIGIFIVILLFVEPERARLR
jgi:hypothetical protein